MRRNRKKRFKSHQGRTLITDLNPSSPIAEQYRTIRTNISFSAVDDKINTLMVTSSNPSEGKSLTTANLAIVFAQQGSSVLLVDADLRKPTLHYTLQKSNTLGLSNYLVGAQTIESIVHNTSIDNLHAVTSGPIPPNPSELLGSKSMGNFIEESKHIYDVIIFDTPPVLAVTDSQILSSLCDGTILVTRNKQTEIDEARRAKKLLAQTNGRLLGTILNDAERKKENYYYYYGN
ncbi:CpsD/CapB family tyrosine-protein kinase [Pontibacillus salicampi]|uniref:non-specific protein-tyrosine kinase n=1 Tax=Pontibacillus salicampi TaxID=1449801 RepID=A0ABV6LSD5_9BACI